MSANAGQEDSLSGCDREQQELVREIRYTGRGISAQLARDLLIDHGDLDLPPELLDAETGDPLDPAGWSGEQLEAWLGYLETGEGAVIRGVIYRSGTEFFRRFDQCGNPVRAQSAEID